MKTLLKYLLFSIFCLGSLNPVVAQQAEELFQQGMMKEESEGNLNQAIEIGSVASVIINYNSHLII